MKLQTANCKLLIGCRWLIAVVSVGMMTGVAQAEEVIDRVLAIVSGDLITLTDVMAARDLGLVPVTPAADPIRDVLPRLIDRELILAEVDRYSPPEPGVEALDAAMRVARGRFASEQAFQSTLARSGITENHLRETLRQDLRIQAYLDQRFAVAPFTDEELGRYYRVHLQTFTRGGAVEPFESARPAVVQAAAAEQRAKLVEEWIAGLRRRSDIVDLSIADR